MLQRQEMKSTFMSKLFSIFEYSLDHIIYIYILKFNILLYELDVVRLSTLWLHTDYFNFSVAFAVHRIVSDGCCIPI